MISCPANFSISGDLEIHTHTHKHTHWGEEKEKGRRQSLMIRFKHHRLQLPQSVVGYELVKIIFLSHCKLP